MTARTHFERRLAALRRRSRARYDASAWCRLVWIAAILAVHWSAILAGAACCRAAPEWLQIAAFLLWTVALATAFAWWMVPPYEPPAEPQPAARGARITFTSGHADFLKPGNQDRRFWPITADGVLMGDGTGQALPPVPETAYPPHANPLLDSTPGVAPCAPADSEALVLAIREHLDGWCSATFGWQDDPDPVIAERNKQAASEAHAAECLRRIRVTLGVEGRKP